MSRRRKFSAEFRRGAVEQASHPGVSCALVARELGIRNNLLTRWKRMESAPRAEKAGDAGRLVTAQRRWAHSPCEVLY